ncbi:hypothetical protein [Streptomyces sp. NPDC003832]
MGRLPEDVLGSDVMDAWQRTEEGDRHRLEDMLLWGGTNGADALCWVTSDPDPDRWPVAVWTRQGGGWAVHECGMTEFVARVLEGDFAECPLSVSTLWQKGSARFLNFRKKKRRLDEGVDAWTGRSTNPFAGLH